MDYKEWKKRLIVSTYTKVLLISNTDIPVEQGVSVASTIHNGVSLICLIGNTAAVNNAFTVASTDLFQLAAINRLTVENTILLLRINNIVVNNNLAFSMYVTSILNDADEIIVSLSLISQVSTNAIKGNSKQLESIVQARLEKEIIVSLGTALTIENFTVSLDNAISVDMSSCIPINFSTNIAVLATSIITSTMATPKYTQSEASSLVLLSGEFILSLSNSLVISRYLSLSVAPTIVLLDPNIIDSSSTSSVTTGATIILSTEAPLEYYEKFTLDLMKDSTLEKVIGYI